MTYFEVNWKNGLSRSSLEAAQDAAEYAYPQTIEGCWKKLDEMLNTEHITQSTYDEIKERVTFELVED